MTTDYANKPPPPKPKKSPRKIMSAIIIIIGLVLIGGYVLQRLSRVKPIKVTPATGAVAPAQLHFDFYTLLARPSDTTHPTSAPVAQVSAAPPTQNDNATYMLQIAALGDQRKANKLRDHLTAEGFHALVQTHRDSQVTWYRVLSGPYFQLDTAKQDQHTLQHEHFAPLLISLDKLKP